MSKAESTKVERRTARRYRVPGSARVFWDGDGAAVTIADMSAGGCLVIGPRLPEVGTRVFLSLDIGGLPNVRLPAITVRVEARRSAREQDHDGADEERIAAVCFDVPKASVGGLDQLLAQHVQVALREPHAPDGHARANEPQAGGRSPAHEREGMLTVLLVDSDERSRDRIAHTLRAMGAQVRAVDSAAQAMREASKLAASVVLARADVEGLAALSSVSHERPSAFRVAFGRKPAVDSALAHGIAQGTADDPCSAKCLGELLRRGRSAPP